MVKRIRFILLAALLAFGLTSNGWAELFAVSPNTVPVGVAAPVNIPQFPQWYQDFSSPPPSGSGDFNPNYGIGPSPGGLTLEICPDLNVDPMCISDVAGGESFWWSADALTATSTGQALLVLALEGAFAGGPPLAGDEISFGRVRIRVDVPVTGTYTVTHPFGVEVITVDDTVAGINFTNDIGIGAVGTFTGALASDVGPFLFWDADLPVLGTGANAGNFYIGNPAIGHRVLGSPFGTNFFRVDGPPGSGLGGPGIDFVETDLFTVTGKVFTGTPAGTANTAPVAVPEAASTLAATPVVIDVLANDTFTNIPINPGSLTFSAPVGGTAAMTVVDGRVKATFTPAPGFLGDGGFTYTVAGFAGAVSNPATVTVTVEDLKVNKAEFRPKFLKWRITGTSSDTTANTIGIQSGPPTVSTTLSGANEVPSAVTSPGGGTASVTVGEGSINFTLGISGLLNITSTHLHLGAPGTNGPVLFTLAGPNVASVPNGTLTAADLATPLPAGITSFADAVNAILSGNTYIQVHTASVPAGEVRGQLGPNRLVGTATVQGTGTNGTWALDGKSLAFPDDARTITVRSSNGVRVINVPLMVK